MFENVPGPQRRQLVRPDSFVKEPGRHFVQLLSEPIPLLFDTVPAGHGVHPVAALGEEEKEPRGHSSHPVERDVPENCPIGHDSHSSSCGRPAMTEKRPAGQSLHDFDSKSEENVPTGHTEHETSPGLDEKFPGKHG